MEAFLFAEYVGIASASLSGFLFGIRRGCDWLGVFLAAFLTALGGGLIRDMIVGRPAYSFTHYIPVCIVLAVMILAFLLKFHQKERSNLDKKFIFIMTDAVDVVSFSIVGAIVSLEFGLNIFGVIMVAFFNGVGGGIMRDVLLNEVPWFLKTGLYGTISMGVGAIYYLMHLAGLTNIYCIFVLFTFGVTWRLVAYYRNWNLPQIHYKD
ncbi:MAG: TRIC cation channel family protein [Campylobacter sp.]|uniref:trimeric intracellular cation channel family protein n=1 Tax=Campylobacter vicugnae TaxID=1660076 RepID=UPI000A34D896|nr:TRIC cation channel family protein [Campylobacter sp. S0112]MBR2221569.1 TRIC cation channel family protein [Campylobacter sp.]